MIEVFTPEDVRTITGQELAVADQITEDDLAVLGQIPLDPTVFNYINGVLEGDIHGTPIYHELRSIAIDYNQRNPASEIDTSNPRSTVEGVRASGLGVATRLLEEHDEFAQAKRAIVRDMRAESLAGCVFPIAAEEEIEYVPEDGRLFITRGQLSALASVGIGYGKDPETGVLLLPQEGMQITVATDTSEDIESSHDKYRRGADSEPRQFEPLDTENQQPLTYADLARLAVFTKATVRMLPTIIDVIPQLTAARG